MGRIQSERIVADTNIVERLDSTFANRDNPCVFNGIIISVLDSAGPAAGEIRVYSDDTGSGTTNLIWRTDFKYTGIPGGDPHAAVGYDNDSTKQYIFTNGIMCKTGLRVEAESWTNLECFVLHS
tara:strand:+ start:948 stop:1319 length:372 start_codon:yes stop_codon:yes gene_type:complete